MKDSEQKLGLRIIIATSGERKALFFNQTEKSGPEHSAPYKLVQPRKGEIVDNLDPAVIGKTVLKMLELE